ncbi:MAG: tRNA (N6-isopentenyl adenosine(37)-C2)-methylthiotransferase MiaB [Deltaproteobacteria bacterium RBG_16_48_10]|nr:MAG: tRNA (N6-isopentenyl adenosine(37)-C2)-methylthiotransferase MiaB [Deltaproteobacteria bacterium RBG_16_48_10]
MNEHDTERMLCLLEGSSFRETKEVREADLILINTCSVREKPEHKVYSALGRFKRLKEEKGTIIGVAGCVAQQEGERLLDRVPYIDLVIGTHALSSLPNLVRQVVDFGQRICETGYNSEGAYLKTPLPQKTAGKVKSYVTLMQGCNRFCSFCIVPYVRGREKSRPSLEILEELKKLADRGVKEVCLLGQNVNAYGKGLTGEIDFPGLLRCIDRIEGIKRIRFTTSHPADLSEGLIQAFSELRSLCEHIHLPFQSGSDRILDRMHRGYTKANYLEKIEGLKKRCPSIAITADVIVGFPGEDEEDFHETLDVMEKVRFDDLYSFKYSPRRGTRAAQFQDQVETGIKEKRLSILQGRQREITFEKNRALEGCVVEVLVEGQSKQSDQDVTGRTRSNKIVNVKGERDLIGRLISVRITRGFQHSLRGEIIHHEKS